MESRSITRRCLDVSHAPAASADLDADDLAAADAEGRFHCAVCGHPVTGAAERIVVAGGHVHTCTNPHGLSFRIGCFRAAAGCSAHGTETSEWTWFVGYAWRVAVCRGCGAHLGWSFRARDGHGFHGLILVRLVWVAGRERPH